MVSIVIDWLEFDEIFHICDIKALIEVTNSSIRIYQFYQFRVVSFYFPGILNMDVADVKYKYFKDQL